MRYLLANPAYRSIAGAPDSPVVGRTVSEVFPPEVARTVEPFVQQVFKSGELLQIPDYEAPVRGRTWWNVSEIPLRDAAGNTEAVLVLTMEVTEQKLAEERVRQSEQRYRLLFDRNPDGVFAVDAAGRFILANPACESISGYSTVELLKKSFMELCTPLNCPKHWRTSSVMCENILTRNWKRHSFGRTAGASMSGLPASRLSRTIR